MKHSLKAPTTSLSSSGTISHSIPSLIGNTLWKLFLGIVKFFSEKALETRRVVIVGAGEYAIDLYRLFNSDKSISYKFLGFFDNNTENNPYKNHIKGDIHSLKGFCLKEEVDEIYFTLPLTEKKLIKDISRFADDNFIYFRMVGNLKEADNEIATSLVLQKRLSQQEILPVAAIRREPLASRFNQKLKRCFDIFFSLVALAFLVPFVFPLIALAIKIESSGPVFFIQQRPGRKNKLFNCFKFRTMRVNNQSELQATKNDSRITKVGAFLRKTSLDELPQFFNVLIGDMSVVGPRPNMVKQLEFYSKLIDNYSFRHFVTPGITGLAQINGFRGETQTLDLMEKRVEYDLKYMEAWSFWMDLKIIFLTVYNIFKGEENAY